MGRGLGRKGICVKVTLNTDSQIQLLRHKLNWNGHINYLCLKLARSDFILRKSKSSCFLEKFISICCSFVTQFKRTVLGYGG